MFLRQERERESSRKEAKLHMMYGYHVAESTTISKRIKTSASVIGMEFPNLRAPSKHIETEFISNRTPLTYTMHALFMNNPLIHFAEYLIIITQIVMLN